MKVRNPANQESISPEQLEEEEEALENVDTYTVIEYIRNSFDILLNLKMEETRRSSVEGGNHEDLEKMLQKLEGDVRQHIRVEQQLKLHIESVQERLEEQEKEADN